MSAYVILFGLLFWGMPCVQAQPASPAGGKPSDIILEVGPGIGTLTQALAEKAEKVIAIEKDKKMIEILSETLSKYKNIEVINADILRYDLEILWKSDFHRAAEGHGHFGSRCLIGWHGP